MTHIQQKEVTRKKLFRVTKFFKDSFKCFKVNYVSVQSPELPESLHISRQKVVTNLSLIPRKPTGIGLQYFLYRLKIAFAFSCNDLKFKGGTDGRAERNYFMFWDGK